MSKKRHLVPPLSSLKLVLPPLPDDPRVPSARLQYVTEAQEDKSSTWTLTSGFKCRVSTVSGNQRSRSKQKKDENDRRMEAVYRLDVYPPLLPTELLTSHLLLLGRTSRLEKTRPKVLQEVQPSPASTVLSSVAHHHLVCMCIYTNSAEEEEKEEEVLEGGERDDFVLLHKLLLQYRLLFHWLLGRPAGSSDQSHFKLQGADLRLKAYTLLCICVLSIIT